MAVPIWKDVYYTTTADTLEYQISDGNDIIFSGKAYKYPDGSNLSIKINDLCANHLQSDIPISVWLNNTGNVTVPNAIKTFTLTSNNTTLSTYTFINDWSYKTLIGTNISRPINKKYDVGMWCFSSTVSNNNVVVNYRKSGGNGYTIQGCGDYALYYCNRFSGWDSLLIEGKVIEGKDLTTFNYQKSINNNNYGDRENNRFQTNIKQNWVLNTGWLSDDESDILYDNLLSSNYIYLHKISENMVIPVHITDTSVTNKNFNNERKLINYTIRVEADNIEYIK